MQKKKIEEALPFTIAALSAAAHSVQNHRHVIAKRFDKQAEVCDPMVAESPTSVRKEPRVMLLFSNNPTSSFESMGENPDACTMDNASVKFDDGYKGFKMFSSSQFDASNAFSGGGFMSSQPNDSSPAPTKNRDSQGLVPVTVKQISEASHSGDEKSNFSINGVDLTNVTLVGIVYEKAERNTDVNFVLDDGTGRITCRRWINESFDTKEMEEVMDGKYVRVYGHLKSFQGVRQLTAFSVRPVTNFDEIPFHFIDCIHNHLCTKVKTEGGIPSAFTPSNSSMNTPVKSALNGSQAPPSNPGYAQYSTDGLKDIDKLVIDYLQQHSDMSDERGIHVNDLAKELRLPLEKIMLSLKTLGDDGLVYSTIDDFHYKQA